MFSSTTEDESFFARDPAITLQTMAGKNVTKILWELIWLCIQNCLSIFLRIYVAFLCPFEKKNIIFGNIENMDQNKLHEYILT